MDRLDHESDSPLAGKRISFVGKLGGMTRREAMLCHQTAVIPTAPGFPTMNLAQAAGVFCYRLSESPGPSRPLRRRADSAILERLHERLQSLLGVRPSGRGVGLGQIGEDQVVAHAFGISDLKWKR